MNAETDETKDERTGEKEGASRAEPWANTGLRSRVDSNAGSQMEDELLALLSAYDKVGIASRDRLRDAPEEFHPNRIMAGFESVIVLARVPTEKSKESLPGKFHRDIAMIAAQDSVVRYLKSRGFRADIVGSRATQVSLPRLGERGGVGELSPFGTLAVKGHGLRAVLSAIVTDAPLRPSPLAKGACPNRDACLRRCPALGADGVFDRSKCISCGACVRSCPAE